MKLTMIGLGKMGGNMAERLRRHDIEVVVWRNGESLGGALRDSDDWTRIHKDGTYGVWVRS